MRVLIRSIFVLAILFLVTNSVNLDIKRKPKTIIYILNTSWYGPGFHGRRTANGERYNMYNLTAAHRTWPFGTKLRLINPENNKSTIVVINDRGPYNPKFLRGRKKRLVPHPDRFLDISYQAAKKLDIIKEGVAELWVEIIEP